MRLLRIILVFSYLAGGSGALGAEPPLSAAIALPMPTMDGNVSVEKALNERRSDRDPSPQPLTLAEIGQLCWAAQGVTDSNGHRTASSAWAVYPLELYLIAGAVTGLPPGLYHYMPANHSLELVSAGDKRAGFVEKAVGQNWITNAPAVFIVTGTAEKMARMKERGRQFMLIETGLAAQGFFLEATVLGLGSTFVGGFDPAAAHGELGLTPEAEVLAVLPVGRKKD